MPQKAVPQWKDKREEVIPSQSGWTVSRRESLQNVLTGTEVNRLGVLVICIIPQCHRSIPTQMAKGNMLSCEKAWQL